MADFNTWKNSVLGVGLNIDNSFGKQCVDVLLSWAQASFSGTYWSVMLPPPPSRQAKDLYTSASNKYFLKLPNTGPNFWRSLKQGDLLFYDSSPQPGYTSKFANPDGHCAVLDHADATYAYVIQQDGSDPNTKTYYKARPWNYTRCIGALRPLKNIVQSPAPSVGDGRIGRTLYIHGIPAKSVVRVGAEPVAKNIIGYLLPAKFRNGPARQPGLQFKIVGVSQYANTVTIKTESYRLVDVYVDKDCEIL